jgi:hypothetical protein
MVSNMFAKSLGYGGSAPVKTKASIVAGGGRYSKPDHSGDQDAAKVSMPKQRPGFQERDVTTGSGAKGNGGSVNCWATTKDPNQKGGSRYGK